MVAFNFKEYFADDIIEGRKLSTIRSTMRCKVGDHMHLYTGQRTKNCRKLRDTICCGIAEIFIDEERVWEIIGSIGNIFPANLPLHKQEGFINAEQFVNFFKENYGLPYIGYLHAWEKPNDQR